MHLTRKSGRKTKWVGFVFRCIRLNARNKMLTEYPLKSVDHSGNPLCVGDQVLILKIPLSLVYDMQEDSRKVVESCKGEVMKIYEIDQFGFVWLEKVVVETDEEYVAEKFALEPNLLERQDGI